MHCVSAPCPACSSPGVGRLHPVDEDVGLPRHEVGAAGVGQRVLHEIAPALRGHDPVVRLVRDRAQRQPFARPPARSASAAPAWSRWRSTGHTSRRRCRSPHGRARSCSVAPPWLLARAALHDRTTSSAPTVTAAGRSVILMFGISDSSLSLVCVTRSSQSHPRSPDRPAQRSQRTGGQTFSMRPPNWNTG